MGPDELLPKWAQKLVFEVNELKLWRQQQDGSAAQYRGEAWMGNAKTRCETALVVVPDLLTDPASGTAPEDALPMCDDGMSVCSFKLEESMWDAALLLGVQGQEVACTAWSMIILLLNVLTQAMLAFIIATQMTEPSIDETTVSGFRCLAMHVTRLSRFSARGVSRTWRVNIAQHVVRHLCSVCSRIQH